jgi:hypothetical protein
MRHLAHLAVIAALALSTAGCASIVSGSMQEMGFRSSPEGAMVTVNGRVIGKTPISVRLKKSENQAVTFEKDGFKTLTVPMSTRLDGWFWGNIAFGGLIGSTTDSASGSMHEYSPSQYIVTLEPLAAGAMDKYPMQGPQQKAREFIIIGYRSLITDIKAGKGEYLTSLLDLFSVPSDDRPAATKRLSAFADAYPDIPDFADHVVDAYMKPAAAAAAAAPQQPLGNWDALRDDGSLPDLYRYLTADEFKDAQAKAESMRRTRRDELTEYILGNSGKKRLLGWGFDLNANLPPEESRFISWYLLKFTSYKPAQ